MEMFNLNCKLINFIRHVKERCGLDFEGECFSGLQSCSFHWGQVGHSSFSKSFWMAGCVDAGWMEG